MHFTSSLLLSCSDTAKGTPMTKCFWKGEGGEETSLGTNCPKGFVLNFVVNRGLIPVNVISFWLTDTLPLCLNIWGEKQGKLLSEASKAPLCLYSASYDLTWKRPGCLIIQHNNLENPYPNTTPFVMCDKRCSPATGSVLFEPYSRLAPAVEQCVVFPGIGTMASQLFLILILTSLSSFLKAERNGKRALNHFSVSPCNCFHWFRIRIIIFPLCVGRK